MSAMRWIYLLGMATFTLGCKHEPPVVAPPPVEVVISQPVSENIVDWDTYTGTVDPREFVEVRSRVRGHIKEVRFKEGTEIARGTKLFLIDSEPFQADLEQAKGQLASWEAKLKFADEKIGIYNKLGDKGSVSKEELFKAISDKGEALGNVAVAKGKILDAQLNIGYCDVAAPIGGKVGEALITKGNLVNSSGADSILTTVVGVDPMYVYFYVNENAFQKYRKILLDRAAKDPNSKGDKLKVPVEMEVGNGGGFIYKGVVDFVDNRVDASTGSLKVRAKFENPLGPDDRRPLTPGLFARVRVSIAEPYKATLVANRAILSDQSLKYVLVVNKEKSNLVERKDIVPADRVQPDGLRAVAGLKGDEWIIVEGVNRTRPGAVVSPKDAIPMPRRPVAGK